MPACLESHGGGAEEISLFCCLYCFVLKDNHGADKDWLIHFPAIELHGSHSSRLVVGSACYLITSAIEGKEA